MRRRRAVLLADGRASMRKRPRGSERATEFFNRQMQSGVTTKLVAERANGPQH